MTTTIDPTAKLSCSWKLYYGQTHNNNNTWSEDVLIIKEFDTIKDFWEIINNIQEPDSLPFDTAYYLFKSGIEPRWEDERNASGGQWRYTVSQENSNSIWYKTMVAIISGQLDVTDDEICGCVFQRKKKGNRTGVWTKSKDEINIQGAIGHLLYTAVWGCDAKQIIEYAAHKVAEVTEGSRRQNVMYQYPVSKQPKAVKVTA